MSYCLVNMRSYHYILLNIKVDSGIVQIMDSLAKPEEAYQSIIDTLKR